MEFDSAADSAESGTGFPRIFLLTSRCDTHCGVLYFVNGGTVPLIQNVTSFLILRSEEVVETAIVGPS